jgi:hypothetical protein
MNPMPVDVKPSILSLAIDEADQTASLELALDTASQFGISLERAKAIAHEVGMVESYSQIWCFAEFKRRPFLLLVS